jgi:enoyl-CoA hydratase/carnithine racemase
MPFEDILVEVQEPLAVITLNRPTVLNALRSQLLDELSTALRDL